MRRRDVLGCGLAAMLLAACKSGKGTDGNKTALRPEDPVDDAFLGCQKSCGARHVSKGVVLQPDAKVGDTTRCLVSGAAFQVTERTVQRSYGGRVLFLCCEECARYFDQHAEAVMALRHVGSATT
jgi:YHS domain-containing protein